MIAVILPCYRSKAFVLDVLRRVDDRVEQIIIVDDACPEQTGRYVEENFDDPRLQVLFHSRNTGVGGAMKTGFIEALKGDCDIIVKLDSDGQMRPEIMHQFTDPINEGRADYCKGNRFFDVESLEKMPRSRLIGNAGLSFLTKLSSGYWTIMDPTNGYVALHRRVLENLPLGKLDDGFFFETDLLFRANTIGAFVIDVPMRAVYGEETSNLSVLPALLTFTAKHLKLFVKRIFYNYFLRSFSVASLNLVLGSFLTCSGLAYGASKHFHYANLGLATPTGIQAIVMLLIIIGIQLLISFISYDISHVPSQPIHQLLPVRITQIKK